MYKVYPNPYLNSDRFLAKGFIASMRHADGDAVDLSPDRLEEVFRGTLTLLYRLLFLLYAESRDLLPVRETRGYWERSLSRLKRAVAEAAGPIKEEVEAHLKKAYSADPTATGLYNRLAELARTVDQGDATVNTPLYNGGLFLSEIESADETPEAVAAHFLLRYKVPDRYLALALDRLARDLDEKRGDLAPIDYKSLGVRQLGSIYEGLLEFRPRIAPETMAIVRGKKTEEIVPYREAVAQKRAILSEGRGRNAIERTRPKGAVYLENDRRERKATGSYYTPDYIVKYIVAHAVGPVLQEHLERLRPALRLAQQAYRDATQRQAAFQKQGMKGDDPAKVANDPRWLGLVDDLFAFRALDPAMGSGHFLVEAVDFIADKLLDFLNGFPWNPVQAQLRQTRETILAELERQGVVVDHARLTDVNLLKRHVLKRCIYGVDLNPMAVELAKVSLWLHCFTLGAPLSFLDHHLKCGNSLIGTTVQNVEAELAAGKQGHVGDIFGSPFAGLLSATALIEELSHVPDATVEQSRRSHSLFAEFEKAQKPFKAALDIWVSRFFGNQRAQEYLTLVGGDYVEQIRNGGKNLSPEYQQVITTAAKLRGTRRFFHWDLEFPEVFVDLRTKDWKTKEQQGFDAVVGNPPYDVLASEELGYDVSQDLAYYHEEAYYVPAIRGKTNLYKLFICRATSLVLGSGGLSFIVPMALLGDDQSAGVRRLLLEKAGLIAAEAFPQKDDPRDRVFPEAKLATTIFVARAAAANKHISIRTHPGRFIREDSPTLRVSTAEILRFDPVNATVPSCTQRDWEIATKIIGNENMKRLGDYCQASQGEVNETTDGKRGFISSNPNDGPQILRGSTVCLYAVRAASQGESLYLDVSRYVSGKNADSKGFDHRYCRVGFQRSAPQNNFRRVIAAPIPRGSFCFDTVGYVTETSSQMGLDLLLALLNSRIVDWYFRLGSTNSKVNEYQFNLLPAPTLEQEGRSDGHASLVDECRPSEEAAVLIGLCVQPGLVPASVANGLVEMSRRIQRIEAARVLKSRSERSHLAPESQPIQDAIDAVLFRCYGLTEDEAAYVTKRLGEML